MVIFLYCYIYFPIFPFFSSNSGKKSKIEHILYLLGVIIMSESLFERMHDIGLIPVLRMYDSEKAVPLARALNRGGLPCATITYCLKTAPAAIRNILSTYPDMNIGCSTVITAQAAREAMEAGAQFIITQGFNTEVIHWCINHSIAVIPGINDEETLKRGIEMGLSTFNFFPCEISGGISMLRRLSSKYPEINFLASGGVDERNFTSYARQPNVLASICPWVSQDEWVEDEQWETIEQSCKQALLKIQGLEISHMSINNKINQEAAKTIKGLETLGMLAYPGKTSTFMETDLEILLESSDETKGHLTFKCYDVERTLSYLAAKGFTADRTSTETAINGKIKTIKLLEEVGGFCIHLVRS
jgi:2-dehydro-3-deoxyphosphogluconate aldolase/(4S)-4-hydroxy-2-oxoglutarate aldolase